MIAKIVGILFVIIVIVFVAFILYLANALPSDDNQKPSWNG
jgi:hypothetical protein